MAVFQKATKKKSKLRMAIPAPPGAGKTYSALKIGRALVGPEGRIAVIDTERGSASKYSDEFDFDVVELDTFSPESYIDAIKAAEAEGYDLLIPDSLSHAWFGTGGMLEKVDKIAKARYQGNSFAAWKDANPSERALWDTLLSCGMHVIATLRTKTEWVVEESQGRDGRKRTAPRKVGLAPIQREGLEYEFDVVAEMNMEHDMVVTKTRCKALTDGVYNRPGAEVAAILRDWLDSGETTPSPAQTPPPAEAATEPEPAAEPRQPRPRNGKGASAMDGSEVGIHAAIRELAIPADIEQRILDSLMVGAWSELAAEQLADVLGKLRTIYRHSDSAAKPLKPVLTHANLIALLSETYDCDPITAVWRMTQQAED